MGVLVKVRFEGGKVRYPQQTQGEIEIIKKLKQFVAAHEGAEAYKYFMDIEEVNMHKKLPNFYKMIMLQPLFEKMAAEYGVSSIHEVDAILSLWFLKKKKQKLDATAYEIPMRIEAVSLAEQIEFVGKVSNFAITKYGIKYPNANEVDGLGK